MHISAQSIWTVNGSEFLFNCQYVPRNRTRNVPTFFSLKQKCSLAKGNRVRKVLRNLYNYSAISSESEAENRISIACVREKIRFFFSKTSPDGASAPGVNPAVAALATGRASVA